MNVHYIIHKKSFFLKGGVMARTKFCTKGLHDGKGTRKVLATSILPQKQAKINLVPPSFSSFQKAKFDFSSKYDHSWCSKVLELGSQGMSMNTIALKLGISHTNMFLWAKRIPEFKEAIDSAQELSKGWWEEMGRLNLENKLFNNTLYMMNMQNRFGWHRYIDPSTPMVVNNQIQQNITHENSITIDYSKLSTDELKQLDTTISRAIIQH